MTPPPPASPLPAGAGADDDEHDVARTADALASIDISTPLRDDEHLPTHEHRKADAGKGGRGRGRARVLGGPAPAAAPAPAAEEPKKKKSSKKAAAEAEAAAAAAAAAEPPKKSKKKAAAAADEAPAAGGAASSAAAPKKAAKAAEPPAKQGEDFAAAPPRFAPFAGDKVVRVSYSVTAVPASAPPALLVTFRIEPRSLKKAVESIDAVFAEGAPLVPRPGAAAGAPVRLAAGLKERAKGKDRTVTTTLLVLAPTDVAAPSAALPVTLAYRVAGATAAPLQGRLVLSSASGLVPVVLDPEAYRNLMTSEAVAASFEAAAAQLRVRAGSTASALIDAVLGILRTYAVARSPKHAILYARALVGAHHVTALLRVDSEDESSISLTVKSAAPGHAALLLADVTAAIAEDDAAAAAAAAKKDAAEE